MWILVACASIAFSGCHHTIEAQYNNMAECEAAVKNLQGRPNITYAFCRPDLPKK